MSEITPKEYKTIKINAALEFLRIATKYHEKDDQEIVDVCIKNAVDGLKPFLPKNK